MELQDMTDFELSEHLNAVLNEQERRQSLDTIPHQIKQLANNYETNGGIKENLIESLT